MRKVPGGKRLIRELRNGFLLFRRRAGGQVNNELSLWQYRACRPPGTTRSRHCFIPEEIYFAVSKIHGFSVLYGGFESERPEVFCKHRTSKVNAFGIRD